MCEIPVDNSNVALGLPKVFGGSLDHVLIEMLDESWSCESPWVSHCSPQQPAREQSVEGLLGLDMCLLGLIILTRG